MALITVITPTYNRGKELDALFASLQKQTCHDFEWLVVDDGSTDDTEDRVNAYLSRAVFPVRYIYKENGGKHTALNAGIRMIESELTFIVDSDDTVVTDGIEVIEKFYHKHKNLPNIGMLSFLKINRKHGVVLKMPKDETVGSYVSERVRKNRPGDMAEVFWTKALKQFPFPEFPGERFLSEDVVWIPFGIANTAVFINRPIYEFEYLEDGLTNNDKLHKFFSPLGSMLRGKMLMKRECGLRANIKGAIIYNCYRNEVKDELPDILKQDQIRQKLLTMATWPLGLFFHKRWKQQAR